MENDLNNESKAPEMWVIAELMGHKRIAGRASEFLFAGYKFVRIDVPNDAGDGWLGSPTHNPKSFYGFTPVSEEEARAAARYLGYAKPVPDYGLRALTAGANDEPITGDESDGDADEDREDLSDAF